MCVCVFILFTWGCLDYFLDLFGLWLCVCCLCLFCLLVIGLFCGRMSWSSDLGLVTLCVCLCASICCGGWCCL